MMSAPQSSTTRNHPLAYFETAISFQIAADILFDTIKSPRNQRPLRDPTYYLYHQAVELALKACLLSRGLDIPAGGQDPHDIGMLFEQCRTAKFLRLNDTHFNMHNLVVMLGNGNRWQRYRYPGPNNERFIPVLDWVHETVPQLLEAVRPYIAEWVAENPSPAPPATRVALGKPTYRKQPVPPEPGPG